jgi:hypothetical protein
LDLKIIWSSVLNLILVVVVVNCDKALRLSLYISYSIESEILKNFPQKKVGLAKLSYLQDPRSLH